MKLSPNSKWGFLTPAVIALFVLCSLPHVTKAQTDKAALAAMYSSSATVSTGIAGIRTFAAPPAGFDPLAAADADLARYGYPPHPDPQANPDGYAIWARNVRAFNHRPVSLSKDMGAYNGPAQQVPAPPGAKPAALPGGEAGPTTGYASNWSGVVNTNKLTKWNTNTSFDLVISEFNVPVAQQPFGACDGGDDGLGAAHGLQRLGRIANFVVDVVVRAKGPRQGFLVAPPIYRNGAKPLPGGELDAQVAKSADPMDRHQIARRRAAMA